MRKTEQELNTREEPIAVPEIAEAEFPELVGLTQEAVREYESWRPLVMSADPRLVPGFILCGTGGTCPK